MSSYEIIAATVIVVFLFGIVGYFSWQEIGNLRRARVTEFDEQEQRRVRYRAWRRLFCCLLLLGLAGLLIGNYFIDRSRTQILEPGEANGSPMSDEQLAFWHFYSYYWIAILLVLLAVILIVGYDLWSLRRWGLREQRRLHHDHREMLKHEVSTYLRQRNGHKG
jgi:uncharacterized iron-regulated membrane protein